MEVKGRLQQCSDLPVADALYHGSCYTRFYQGQKPPNTGEPPSIRQDHDDKYHAFLKMCDWFENCDELCSLVDLRQHMLDRASDENRVYSVQSLKRKLIERYGDHIFFGEHKGRRDIVCLRDMASFIINSKWYTDRKENVCEESERIILAAAKLVRAQIHERSYSKDCYPTTSDITDRAVLKDWIPEGLYLLMKSLVPDELKQITISHTIVQASRPKSVDFSSFVWGWHSDGSFVQIKVFG